MRLEVRTSFGQSMPGIPDLRSDAAARFEVDVPKAGNWIVAAKDPDWMTVMSAEVRGARGRESALVVVAPALMLGGRVLDSQGQPIAGATLRVVWPSGLRAVHDSITDTCSETAVRATTGSTGRFELAAGMVNGAELFASAVGFVPDRRPLPTFPHHDLSITLSRPALDGDAIAGQVVDSRGALVAGARISSGQSSAVADEAGGFRIRPGGDRIVAAAKGCRRGLLSKPETGWPDFVVLHLGAPPLSIRGRVVDEQGQPQADVKVWVTNPTPLTGGDQPTVCEGVAAGCVAREDLFAQLRSGQVPDPVAIARRTATTTWPFHVTSADGTFELKGLEEREYDVRAMDMHSLVSTDCSAIAAGRRDILITLSTQSVHPVIEGVVLSPNGEPLPGVSVRVRRSTVRVGGTSMMVQSESEAVSDLSGRFAVRNVPHDSSLHLGGDEIIPFLIGSERVAELVDGREGPESPIEIEAVRRAHVRVTLANPKDADAIRFYGDGPTPLLCHVFSGAGRRSSSRMTLDQGRTPVFVLPEGAAQIAFFRGGTEVRRQDVQLQLGTINQLSY